MDNKITQSQRNKIVLILFLITISGSFVLFDGKIDDFVPKHIAKVQNILNYGNLSQGDDESIPGFYIFGSIIILLNGFTSEKLIYFPIQLIPYTILFFTVVYRLSGNPIVSSLITLIDLYSGTTGTAKVYFWPHGLGYLLFFSILLIVLLLLKGNRLSKNLTLLAVIAGSSLVYLSYNLTALTIILYFLIMLIVGLITLTDYKYITKISINNQFLKRLIPLLAIMTIIEFGLSQFFYNIFIPSLKSVSEFDISATDKFTISYVNPDLANISLSPIMMHYPLFISLISAIKYCILSFTILIFIYLIAKKIIIRTPINHNDVFLIAFILMMVIYSIPRFQIGSSIITLLYLPGIFCLALLSQYSKELKIWTYLAIIVIIICTLSYYFVMENNNYMNSDQYQFESYKIPENWFNNVNMGYLAVSDELTKNFFILNSVTDNPDDISAIPKREKKNLNIKILSQEDALIITKFSEESLNAKYFILNNRLNRMSLQNWRIIKSWNLSKERINSNKMINKIYSTPLLSVYFSS